MSKFVVQVAHGSQVAAPSLATSLQPRRACLCALIHGSGHNMLWANKHSCRSAIFPTPRCSCVARPRAEPGSGRPRSHAANGLLAAAICSEKRGRSLESCPHCLHTRSLGQQHRAHVPMLHLCFNHGTVVAARQLGPAAEAGSSGGKARRNGRFIQHNELNLSTGLLDLHCYAARTTGAMHEWLQPMRTLLTAPAAAAAASS